MNTKVINLVGASGSGKTSIAKELEKQGYNIIHSYTTREPRCKDEWGHIFINGKLSDNGKDIISDTGIFNRGSMIAYFNSYKSGNHYFATDNQILRGKTNIYVVDPKGAEMVHEFYKGSNVGVVTIYLNVDENIRAERLLGRMEDTSFSCMFEDNPKECPEVWDRIRQDRDIFSIAKCDYSISANGSIDKVVSKVIKVI